METIARRLREGARDETSIFGREVQAQEVRWKWHLVFPGEAEAAQRIRRQVYQSVGRRAKYAARLIVVVVLPTPPFWSTNA